MDEYQVRTWEGWHHHMALSLMAMWFLISETHRGQQFTPALTLPQVRYGLSLLLLEVFCRVEPMVTHPAPPQTRTCAIHAYGSSSKAASARARISLLHSPLACRGQGW